MRNIVLSGASAIALALTFGGSAEAADIGGRAAAAPAMVPVSVFSWSGWYIGGHIGGGRGKFDFSSCASAPCNFGSSGWVGGLQLGYNWQGPSNIVWGVEGDLSAANFETGDGNYVRTDVDVLGSIRARLGLAFDRVLFYGTGGWGFAHSKSAGSETPLVFRNHFSSKPVVGGGMEYAINNNLTTRIEALGYLGSDTFKGSFDDTATVKSIWVGRLAVNYKF